MSVDEYLIDTNILIYHIGGSLITGNFISDLVANNSFNISVLSKIEFLGWDKHTPAGFEKCKKLIETATVYHVDAAVADRAIEMNLPAASCGVS